MMLFEILVAQCHCSSNYSPASSHISGGTTIWARKYWPMSIQAWFCGVTFPNSSKNHPFETPMIDPSLSFLTLNLGVFQNSSANPVHYFCSFWIGNHVVWWGFLEGHLILRHPNCGNWQVWLRYLAPKSCTKGSSECSQSCAAALQCSINGSSNLRLNWSYSTFMETSRSPLKNQWLENDMSFFGGPFDYFSGVNSNSLLV